MKRVYFTCQFPEETSETYVLKAFDKVWSIKSTSTSKKYLRKKFSELYRKFFGQAEMDCKILDVSFECEKHYIDLSKLIDKEHKISIKNETN